MLGLLRDVQPLRVGNAPVVRRQKGRVEPRGGRCPIGAGVDVHFYCSILSKIGALSTNCQPVLEHDDAVFSPTQTFKNECGYI